MDAHEPYFPASPSASERSKVLHVRQDHQATLTGRWNPSAEEVRPLADLYRASLERIDLRRAAITKIYQDLGRWKNTAMVLTADHGQAFCEHQNLFHFVHLYEEVTRVPLFVRPPGGATSPRVAPGWTSLVDVPPTLLRFAGIPSLPSPSGVPLQELLDRPRTPPVHALADGVVWDYIRERLPAGREDLDRPKCSAVYDRFKITAGPGKDDLAVVDLESDPRELRPERLTAPLPAGSTHEQPVASLRNIQAALSGKEGVGARLRSWGYI
jgi:arylsulfatase A-like enzyme